MFSYLQKKDPLNEENHRPVSLLSHLSKVFERLLYKQIETFMNNKLSIKLSGFRKSYNTQYCLTYMLEKWKNTPAKGKMPLHESWKRFRRRFTKILWRGS